MTLFGKRVFAGVFKPLGNLHSYGGLSSESPLSDGRGMLLPLELLVHLARVDPRKTVKISSVKREGRMGPTSKMSHFRHLGKSKFFIIVTKR